MAEYNEWLSRKRAQLPLITVNPSPTPSVMTGANTRSTVTLPMSATDRIGKSAARLATSMASGTKPFKAPLQSLSTVAKRITNVILGRESLPEALQGYAPVVAYFALGAIAGTALHAYITKHDCKEERNEEKKEDRMKYAVYICVKMLNRHSEVQCKNVKPVDLQSFFVEIEKEIETMIGEKFLTKAQGNRVATQMKRGLKERSEELQNKKLKKQRAESWMPQKFSQSIEDGLSRVHAQVSGIQRESKRLSSSFPSSYEEAVLEGVLQEKERDCSDIDIQDTDSEANPSLRDPFVPPWARGTKHKAKARTEASSLPNTPPNTDHIGSAFTVPDGTSSELEDLTPRSSSGHRGGSPTPYYASDDSSSHNRDDDSPSLRARGKEKAVSQIEISQSKIQYEHQATPRPKHLTQVKRFARDQFRAALAQTPPPNSHTDPGMREAIEQARATLERASKMAQISRELSPSTEVSPSHEHSPSKAPRLPRTSAMLRLPPKSYRKGTRLSFLREGHGPHESPPPGTSEYRVAETRKSYREIVEERQHRRQFRKYFEQPQRDASPAPNIQFIEPPVVAEAKPSPRALSPSLQASPVLTVSEMIERLEAEIQSDELSSLSGSPTPTKRALTEPAEEVSVRYETPSLAPSTPAKPASRRGRRGGSAPVAPTPKRTRDAPTPGSRKSARSGRFLDKYTK